MKRISKWLPLSAVALACAQAHAVDFTLGDGVKGKFTGTVSFGTQVRTEDPSPDAYAAVPGTVVGAPTGRLQGQTGGSDLNFEKGKPISTVLKAVTDLDLKKDNLGLFVRASAWKDFTLGERDMPYGNYPNGFTANTPLGDSGFAPTARFSNATLRDVFAYGNFKLDEGRAVDARLGRQVLNWGGSQLVSGGVGSAINPVDFASQFRPGALPVESKLPVAMLSASLSTSGPWALDGFMAFESRHAVLPGCGTYFDVASYAPDGCNFAALASAGQEKAALAAGNYLHRNSDVNARNGGQFGLALGYDAKAWDTQFKAYAMNTHSSSPSLRMTVNGTTVGSVLSANYSTLYAEDVRLFGASFNKKLDPTASVFGEVAYRPNQPLTLNAYDIVLGFLRVPNSVLALNKGILSIPVGGSFDAYDRYGVTTGSIGANKVLPNTLGAQRMVVVGELGFSHVNGLPDPSVLRYGRPLPYNGAGYTGGAACVDAVAGKTCTSNGYISRDAWGLRMLASATYPGAAFNATLTPSLLVAKDMKGWSYDGTFSEGRTMLRPALRADWSNQVYAEVQYTRFSGGAYNLLVDRDYVGLTVGARF